MVKTPSVILLASTGFIAVSIAGPAQAALTYNIYESLGDVIIEASGSLHLPASTGDTTFCGSSGGLGLSGAVVCTGPDAKSPTYAISGPSTIYLGGPSIAANLASGIFTSLDGPDKFAIGALYVSGSSISSSATIKNLSLAALGLPASGTLGTWTLAGTGDTIKFTIGKPAPTTVPGPLAILGAGATLLVRRRLRRHLPASQSAPTPLV